MNPTPTPNLFSPFSVIWLGLPVIFAFWNAYTVTQHWASRDIAMTAPVEAPFAPTLNPTDYTIGFDGGLNAL